MSAINSSQTTLTFEAYKPSSHPSPPKGPTNTVGFIAGIGACSGLLVALLVAIAYSIFFRRRKDDRPSASKKQCRPNATAWLGSNDKGACISRPIQVELEKQEDYHDQSIAVDSTADVSLQQDVEPSPASKRAELSPTSNRDTKDLSDDAQMHWTGYDSHTGGLTSPQSLVHTRSLSVPHPSFSTSFAAPSIASRPHSRARTTQTRSTIIADRDYHRKLLSFAGQSRPLTAYSTISLPAGPSASTASAALSRSVSTKTTRMQHDDGEQTRPTSGHPNEYRISMYPTTPSDPGRTFSKMISPSDTRHASWTVPQWQYDHYPIDVVDRMKNAAESPKETRATNAGTGPSS